MEKGWKKAMLAATALSILHTTAVWAADVNMNLFYHGKNHAYRAKEIKLNINGKDFKDPNMPAVSIDGRTMLPMRGICKELGCEIIWNDDTNEAYAVKDGHTIVFAINKKTGYKDGNPFTMDVPPMIINERTMLPVRALADALDVDIQWNDSARTVYINEEKQEKPPVEQPVTPPQQEKPPVEAPVTPPQQEKPPVQQKVKLTDISAMHNGDEDVVTIKGNGDLGAKVSTMTNPYRIVIDMPGVMGTAGEPINASGLHNIHAIRTNDGKGKLFQVVLEAEESSDMIWEEKNGTVTVRVKKSTLQNVTYDDSRNVLLMKAEKDININAIRHNDAYLNGYYELTLPGNYENIYGYGKRTLGDDKISSIEVNTRGGNTVIRFNQNTVSAYTVHKVDGYYEIRVRNPKEIYNKVLVLDAGHGGNDPGTRGNGMIEKNIALSIAMKADSYIKNNSDIKVYVTRNNDDRPANANRAKMANEIADLMVSIHLNAGAVQANGTETLYTKHSNDNDGTLTSFQAAQTIQKNLTANLNTTNRGVKDRPDLLILNSTHVPAVLVEVCFLSNPGDALKISSDAGQQKAATAIGQAVVQVMNSSRLR